MKFSVSQPIRLCPKSSPIYGRWEVAFVDYDNDFVYYRYDAQNVVDVEFAVNRAHGFKGYTKIELIGFTVNEQDFLLEECEQSWYDLEIILYVLT